MKVLAAVIALLGGVFFFSDLFVPEDKKADAIVEAADQRASRCGDSFGTGWMRGDDSGTLVALTGDHTLLGANQFLPDDSPLVADTRHRGVLCINLRQGSPIDCGTYEAVVAGRATGISSSDTLAIMTPIRVEFAYFAGEQTAPSHSWTSAVKNGCPRQIEMGSKVEVQAVLAGTHDLRREALAELESILG